METWTDAELVMAAQARDTGAFAVLVKRHQSFVLGVAYRVTRDPVLAEDIAQEALFRAWRNLGSFRGDSAFRSWLYRITHNVALNAVTRARETPTDQPLESVTPRSTESQVLARQAERELDVVIGELALELREPLVLREREGMSYEAIAETLGVPLNTVRTRIHRARKQVAHQMEAWR